MRTPHVAVAVAAAVTVATGSAMTAGNTLPSTIAGYGEASVSGATISAIDYIPLTTDHSKLSSVVFTSTTDLTLLTATMTLKNGGTQVGASPYGCNVGVWSGTEMTVTCATSDNPAFADFDTVGLMVGGGR